MPADASYKEHLQTEISDDALKDQLILDYSNLVAFIARRIHSKLPKCVELSDLISVGYIGLIDAISKFDPTRANSFKTYAEHRIRGEIFDELRRMDDVSRSIRDKMKFLAHETSALERCLNRAPSDEELAEYLNIDLESFHKVKLRCLKRRTESSSQTPHLIDTESSQNLELFQSPEHCFTLNADKKLLIKMIEKLPERQKLVLSLYYFEELSLKEIGNVLQVSESRISQLRKAAINTLKKKILVFEE